MSRHGIAPIEKSVEVSLTPGDAFALFTEGIARWWPLASHSVAGERAETVVLEAHEGGRIYERTAGGEDHDWGDVLEVVPGERLVFTWFPGRERSTAQRVEVGFTPSGGGTRVDLVHSGWEALGEAADDTRSGYDTGWDYVLGERFVRATFEPAAVPLRGRLVWRVEIQLDDHRSRKTHCCACQKCSQTLRFRDLAYDS